MRIKIKPEITNDEIHVYLYMFVFVLLLISFLCRYDMTRTKGITI